MARRHRATRRAAGAPRRARRPPTSSSTPWPTRLRRAGPEGRPPSGRRRAPMLARSCTSVGSATSATISEHLRSRREVESILGLAPPRLLSAPASSSATAASAGRSCASRRAPARDDHAALAPDSPKPIALDDALTELAASTVAWHDWRDFEIADGTPDVQADARDRRRVRIATLHLAVPLRRRGCRRSGCDSSRMSI